MTEKQRTRFYFPAWSRCARAQNWRMVDGRLAAAPPAPPPTPAHETPAHRVWAAAAPLALDARTAITPDVLRHACHVVALGCDTPTKRLTSAELDEVVALFRHLAEPENLRAALRVAQPEQAERVRLVRRLQSLAPEDVLLAIARNLPAPAGQWEPPFWEDMPLYGLNELNRIASARYSAPAGAARGSINPGAPAHE